MAFELIYTSAPKGLKPGSRGFATVACTEGMPANYVAACESLSGYSFIFDPHDPNYLKSPIAFSHYVFQLGGQKLSVLSRVAAFGTDYSGRTNKLAYHVMVPAPEYGGGGPAAAMAEPRFLIDSWEGEPHFIHERKAIPSTPADHFRAEHWERVTGDGRWAGVIAERFLQTPGKPVFVVFEPGQDLLPLVAEVIALLPPASRWRFTFNTFFTVLPQGSDCFLRCCLAETDALKASRRLPEALVIDLAAPPPAPAKVGELAECARNGAEPGWVRGPTETDGGSSVSAVPVALQKAAVVSAAPVPRLAFEPRSIPRTPILLSARRPKTPLSLGLGVAAAVLAILTVGVFAVRSLRLEEVKPVAGDRRVESTNVASAAGEVVHPLPDPAPAVASVVPTNQSASPNESHGVVDGSSNGVGGVLATNGARAGTLPEGPTGTQTRVERKMTILGKKNGELSGVPPRGSDIQVDMLACNETTAYLKVEEAAPQTRAKVSGGGGSKRLFGIRHNAADREDVVTVERAGPDSVKVIVNEPNSVQALILRYRQGDSEVEHLVWLQTLQLSGAKHIKNTDKQYTISVPQRMMNRIRDCVDPCTLAAVTTNTIPGTTRGIIKLEAVHLETEGIQFCVNMLERQRGAEYGLTNMEAGIAAITEATNTFVQLGADMAKCEDAIKKAKGKEDKRGLEGAEDQLRNTKKKRDDAFLSIIREVESAVGKSTLPKLQELRTAKPLRYEEVCACAADAQNRLRKQIETASGGLNVNCAASVTHVVVTSSNQPIVEWKQ